MHDFMHIQRFFMSYKSGPYLQFMWRVLAQKNPTLYMAIWDINIYIYGGRAGTRTLDPLIKSQLLYQLSYAPGSNN